MELSRQEYPSMLNTLQPAYAVTILTERVRRVGKLNSEIADWLQERRKVEEAYALGLKKLARKQPPDDLSELGIFSTPWQKIVNSADSIAASHQLLAQKIEVDVEHPLREFASKNREMQSMSTIQGNLVAMAKEVESAVDKAEKLRKKGQKAASGKVAAATAEVEKANSQWDSQAPFVFETLQAVDETRLNHLRDVLTQFQTHEADQVERNRVTAEECLNTLLNVEAADEIQAFATRTISSRPKNQLQRNRVVETTLSSPQAAPVNDDGSSQRSRSSARAQTSASNQDPRQERPSGLRRLGTVMGRRRQNTAGHDRATSPHKRTTHRFGNFGRGSRDEQHEPLPAVPSPKLPSSSLRQDRIESQPLNSTSPAEEPVHEPIRTNGESIVPQPVPTILEPARVNDARNGNIDASEEHAGGATSLQEVRKDSEGFTVPPSSNDVISQAEQEAANENLQSQYKLDIRKDPIHEEGHDAETALANVASHLRSQQQVVPRRQTGTVRGRRDVRNTIFVPSPQGAEMMPGDLPTTHSPLKTGRSGILSPDENAGSDTQSIRSARSLSSLASTSVKHPDMHQPGLNASVVETVSAWFEHGQVTKAVTIGEMALAYNPVDLSAPPESESVRLENFAALEKVAPNPTFVTQVPEKSGEYSINLNNIVRTAVAFKYQVHVDETSMTGSAPIILNPSWKIEPAQTSIILTYSLNPALALSSGQSLILRNLVISINLHGNKVSTCQSKPPSVFLKDRSLVYWRLGDITLDANTLPTKLLARLSTETEAKPGSIEARWEISGEQATGLGSGLQLSQLRSDPSIANTSGPADPFADETTPATPNLSWREVSTVRRLISGKYTA
ncbi:MAG: hypothetical protein M1837_002203 [Sclerophora amabilis]|nr:MAG: hypothetical protein M1837_002203 [Sclerophora amabilis]